MGAEPLGADPAPAVLDLDSLMSMLAGNGGVRTRFRETRYLSILTEPLESSGTLYFSPPDRLARHTTRPVRASVVVQNGRVAIADETGRHSFEISASRTARALVGDLSVVLRGDVASLRARYAVDFASDDDRWTLDLVPRSRALGAIIERLRLTGSGRDLETMETREANGDRTILRFSDTETGLEWNRSELERIFSLDSASDSP